MEGTVDLQTDFSLDPEDWSAFRKLAHRALDEALNFIEGVRERPVWQRVPEEVRERLKEPLPVESAPLEAVYEEFRKSILPYPTGNVHPRFFGWVHGAGQVGNIVAETMAAAMNANCGGRDHGAIYVEQQVVDWCKQAFGLPAQSGGLIVSGTSMANLVALGTARNAFGVAVRSRGVNNEKGRLIAYASYETHDSVLKGIEILGLGASGLRKIQVRGDFTIDIDALRYAIRQDRAAGARPFCVVGSAGTVNTGAIDNLEALAQLCAEEDLWFHVDGAFGALAVLSDWLRPLLKGIERADSVAFDFHKWAHVQYDAACVLIRNAELQHAAYSMRPAYLRHLSRGLGAGEMWPCDLGPELSRSFRALKIWFAFKEHGAHKLGLAIERNCQQAQYLARRVEREPELELLAPCSLNIVCFRVLAPGMNDTFVDTLNEEIVADVQESGIAVPSTSRIRGRLAIRANITNHRTQFNDLDIFVDAVLKAAHARRLRFGVEPSVEQDHAQNSNASR
jgi:glutamate/tyrosine decarboxylase-like PLP-dependent enzyme